MDAAEEQFKSALQVDLFLFLFSLQQNIFLTDRDVLVFAEASIALGSGNIHQLEPGNRISAHEPHSRPGSPIIDHRSRTHPCAVRHPILPHLYN